jgi:hypothetical protein
MREAVNQIFTLAERGRQVGKLDKLTEACRQTNMQ